MKNVLIAATFAVCATAAGAQTETETTTEIEAVETDVTYTVLETSTASNGYIATTTRINDDGTNTYTEHNVSCDPYLIGVVATGATLESLSENRTSDPEMVEIVRGSVEDLIADDACES
jgi:hypothetical protein